MSEEDSPHTLPSDQIRSSRFARLSVILVSPSGASNVGGIARLLGNFGLQDLRIVAPRCEWLGLEAKKMAMRSFSILENARIFETLEEAQRDLQWTVALSGRRVNDLRPYARLYPWAQEFLPTIDPEFRLGLVFGREEWGLTLEEINACNIQVSIPTVDEISRGSINLTSSVGIVLSWLFYLSQAADTRLKVKRREPPPLKDTEAVFFEKLKRLLIEVKFANPQNPEQLEEDLRAMYHRAVREDRDLRILFGILSNIEHSLGLGGNRREETQRVAKP